MRTIHRGEGGWSIEDPENAARPSVHIGHEGDPCSQEIDAEKARALLPHVVRLAGGGATMRGAGAALAIPLGAIHSVAEGARHRFEADGIDGLMAALEEVRNAAAAALADLNGAQTTGARVWVAYHHVTPGDDPEVEAFATEDALWAWLEPLARGYMADGDFDDGDENLRDKAELGIVTRNPEKVCEAVNLSYRDVYKDHGPFLVVVERAIHVGAVK